MRKLVITLSCLAVLTTATSAQDDHNDEGPTRSGYVVVTPTEGSSGGFPASVKDAMVVFETFGLRSEVPALQASVLPATLTTRTVLFASSGIRLSRDVGVGIANPESTDAVVTMTLRRANGNTTSKKTLTVPAGRQTAKFVSEFFADVPEVPVDFDGTLTLTSNTPVGVVAIRMIDGKFSTIPITSLSPSVPLPTVTAGIGGGDAALLPHFATDGGWASEIVVLNRGQITLTVRIDLFQQDGSPLVTTMNRESGSSFQNRVIPPGGLVILAPRDANGDTDF